MTLNTKNLSPEEMSRLEYIRGIWTEDQIETASNAGSLRRIAAALEGLLGLARNNAPSEREKRERRMAERRQQQQNEARITELARKIGQLKPAPGVSKEWFWNYAGWLVSTFGDKSDENNPAQWQEIVRTGRGSLRYFGPLARSRVAEFIRLNWPDYKPDEGTQA